MTKTELLKDLMRFQVSRYNYRIVGHSLYFILPHNNFAVAKLLHTNKPNDYNGISITCVNVPFGEINACELLFSDIFYDETSTTIIKKDDGSFGWYRPPTVLDKLNLSDHIGKYFEIISFIDKTSMFASSGMPALGLGAAATEAYSTGTILEYKNVPHIQAPQPKEDITEYEPLELPMIEDIQNDDSVDIDVDSIFIPEQEENPKMSGVEDSLKETIDPFLPEEVISEPVHTIIEEADTEAVRKGTPNSPQKEEAHTKDISVAAPSIEESFMDEPVKKKSFWGGWFKKKEPKREKTHTVIEKEVLTELKEAVGDEAIPQEKIFLSWDIQKTDDSDVKAALKKTQDEDYELRIFGKGEMANLNLIPWEAYAFNIHKVIVYEGVTSIGANAFKSLKYVETVEIADSVKIIGNSAFEYCENLTDITLPKHLEEIGEFAFSGCESIQKYVLPDSVKVIGDYAFDFDSLANLTVYCSNLDCVSLGQGIDPTRFLVKKSSI